MISKDVGNLAATNNPTLDTSQSHSGGTLLTPTLGSDYNYLTPTPSLSVPSATIQTTLITQPHIAIAASTAENFSQIVRPLQSRRV
jgi:hypothetical protein